MGRKTKELWKQLLHVGKDWPGGGLAVVKAKAKPQFLAKAELTDKELVAKEHAKVAFILKEMEGYAQLAKYRFLKRHYTKEMDFEMPTSLRKLLDDATTTPKKHR